MSDPDRAQEADEADDAEDEYEDEPRNPFDNPYFLPVLLGGFAAWCGWDGFISDKFAADNFDLWFNRIAFMVLGSISAWMTFRARREKSPPNPGAP